MSKVICDVCGTTFPETATQCPICGSAKVSATQTAANSAPQQKGEETTAYSYVKGGRFSKNNVRKRNKTTGKTSADRRSGGSKNSKDEKANVGLIVVVVLLLLAIVAVVVYIAVRVFGPSGPAENTTPNDTRPNISTETSGTEQTEARIPCTQLQLTNSVIELDEAGKIWVLGATPSPADTTDKVTFISADPSIATVTETGSVTAVAGGETTVTVICGEITMQCRVVCSFGEATQPSESQPDTTDPSVPGFILKFDTPFIDSHSGKYDTTLFKKGEKWRAYNGEVSATDITWISDNPAVCTIDANGIVTAVGPGKTEVHAEYQGQTVSCIVRCSWTEEPPPDPTESSNGETTAPTTSEIPKAVISHTDVTLIVGDRYSGSFTLTLKDETGTAVVEWKASEDGVVTIEGNKITAVKASTRITVSATYKDETYTCIVRVRNPS